jgi:hypothetical protein
MDRKGGNFKTGKAPEVLLEGLLVLLALRNVLIMMALKTRLCTILKLFQI